MKDILVYTTHKSASSFIFKLGNVLCEFLGMDFYSINGRYQASIQEKSWNYFIEDDRFRGCFAPIRVGRALPNIPKDLSRYSVIVHVRDPRDVLTSLFYSHAYSHMRKAIGFNPDDEQRKKWEQEGIDRFVLDNLMEYKKRYEDLMFIHENASNPILVRYAELIYDFSAWFRKYLEGFKCFPLARHFREHTDDIDMVYSQIHEVVVDLLKNEFTIPEKEDIYAHKRQLKTGDYLNKLSHETIDVLNEELKEVLAYFSYPVHPEAEFTGIKQRVVSRKQYRAYQAG